MNEQQCAQSSNGDWDCDHLVGAEAIWVIIETFTFYIYMGAAVVFIFQFQMKSLIFNTPNSDISKSVKDFLSYSAINLTWYSMNFCLVGLPPVLIFVMNTAHHGQTFEDRDGSYQKLMYWIWGIHIFQFCFNSRIYVLKHSKEDDKDDYQSASVLGTSNIMDSLVQASKDDEADEDKKFPYKYMEREFYVDRMWIWGVQALSYIGITYFYMKTDGKELAYAIYIPLDMAIFVSMSAFFAYYYQQDKRKKELEEKLK